MFNSAGVKAYQLGVASTEAFEVALYWRGVDCFQTRGLWSATECLGDSLLLSFPWDFTFTKALQNFVLIIDYTHLPSLQCLDYYYYTHNVLLQILYRAEKIGGEVHQESAPKKAFPAESLYGVFLVTLFRAKYLCFLGWNFKREQTYFMLRFQTSDYTSEEGLVTPVVIFIHQMPFSQVFNYSNNFLTVLGQLCVKVNQFHGWRSKRLLILDNSNETCRLRLCPLLEVPQLRYLVDQKFLNLSEFHRKFAANCQPTRKCYLHPKLNWTQWLLIITKSSRPLHVSSKWFSRSSRCTDMRCLFFSKADIGSKVAGRILTNNPNISKKVLGGEKQGNDDKPKLKHICSDN